MVESDNGRKLLQHHPWPASRGDPISRTNWSEQGCHPGWGSLQGSDCQSTRSQASPPLRLGGCHAASVGLLLTGRRLLQVSSLHTVDWRSPSSSQSPAGTPSANTCCPAGKQVVWNNTGAAPLGPCKRGFAEHLFVCLFVLLYHLLDRYRDYRLHSFTPPYTSAAKQKIRPRNLKIRLLSDHISTKNQTKSGP